MKDIIITEKQLEKLVTEMKTIKENDGKGSYMSRQSLFTIATLAYKMWEKMEENESETLEDWQESKIAQAEQSINSVVNSFMYDEFTSKESNDGMGRLNFDDLIIGK
jgi:hypothetical protein